MTKAERNDRGVLARSNGSGAASGITGGGAAGNGNVVVLAQGGDEYRRQACSSLSHLFMRTDGWLRAIPSEDGKQLFLKWKFTRGPWEQHYAMSVVPVWQWDLGIGYLLDKLEAIDLGIRKPTKDTWYRNE